MLHTPSFIYTNRPGMEYNEGGEGERTMKAPHLQKQLLISVIALIAVPLLFIMMFGDYFMPRASMHRPRNTLHRCWNRYG